MIIAVMSTTLRRIVSGGQTGVDRGALDAALAAHFDCGGWAPGDRSAEDGIIPERYPLILLPNGGYRQRTRLNVVDSDGTVIFFLELLTGGARLTRNLCALEKRPYLLIDTHKTLEPRAAAREIMEFVERHAIRVLNVSGARASRWPAGYEFVLAAMSECIHLSTKENSLAEEGVPPQ